MFNMSLTLTRFKAATLISDDFISYLTRPNFLFKHHFSIMKGTARTPQPFQPSHICWQI